jgi:hypothetical protein
LINAVSHPLRRQLLRVYIDEGLPSASATEMAAATNQPVARVSYHLRTLAHCQLLRPVPAPGENGAGGRSPRWALDVEAHWLGLMLDFWSQSGFAG